MKDCIYQAEGLFFKHEISENLPCNTYSMHIHNEYELICFLDGDATHVIEDRKYKLKPGDLILIRPSQYHFIQIDSPCRYERYDILFDPVRHGIDGVELIPEGVDVLSLKGNTTAQEIFHRCDLYLAAADGEVFARVLSHLLSELFYHICLLPHTVSRERAALSPILTEALRYTNEHLCTLRNVGEIAEHLFVSEGYLFRLFRNELHQTPKKYIREKRLLLAEKMLFQGDRPIDVCEACGFSDYTTFYRNYTAFFGTSPAERRG